MTSFISQSATGEDYDAAEQRKKGVRGLSLVRVRSSSNEAVCCYYYLWWEFITTRPSFYSIQFFPYSPPYLLAQLDRSMTAE